MAKWKDVANIWNNIGEVDLRPIRDEALQEIRIAIAGPPGSGRQALAERLRHDPDRPDQHTDTPILIADLEADEWLSSALATDAQAPGVEEAKSRAAQTQISKVQAAKSRAAKATLTILLAGPVQEERQHAIRLAYQWSSAGQKVILILPETGAESLQAPNTKENWEAPQTLTLPVGGATGSAADPDFLKDQFVPQVLKMLPDRHLSLGRNFPLFRVSIAQSLISDTSLSNAAFALSTGLAEVVPVFNLPLNIADMVVITKAQAFLVYRLGLLLGFSTRWQDYITEFGGVVGGGFLWRQLARQLVGLIPLWGIIPKAAVAYTGTYVVGHAVLRWYLTGRHVTPAQLREMYRQSFAEGKQVAGRLLSRVPRPRRRKEKPAELSASTEGVTCPRCGRVSTADARFCQYCGQYLAGETG